jgi:uncharacterized protein (TIGR04255 family)
MAFPDASRVIYENNPLEEVICQLRFPSILKIEAEPPAAFQERIRAGYPFYKSKPAFKLPAGVPPELATMLARDLPLGVGQTAHEFTSRDKKWAVSLTREFLALTCRRYERWEHFKDHLRGPLEALQEVYSPPFFVRVGLRYRDIIRRSVLGLEEVGWAELLQPWVAGMLASPEVAPNVAHSAQELLLRLPEGRGWLRVHHGLAAEENVPTPCYVIDADLFTEQQTEPNHALERLDDFNKQARLFFRWCITERLHEAMRPSPVATV